MAIAKNSALKQALLDAREPDAIIAAAARVAYRRGHSGRDCPDGLVPDERALMQFLHVPESDPDYEDGVEWRRFEADRLTALYRPWYGMSSRWGWSIGVRVFPYRDGFRGALEAICFEIADEDCERDEAVFERPSDPERAKAWDAAGRAKRIVRQFLDRPPTYFVEDVHADWLALPKDERGEHPLEAIVAAWQDANKPAVAANLRPDRIIPAPVAMFDGDDSDPRRRLFSPAMHVVRRDDGAQHILAGFERDIQAPALPLVLYDLGIDRRSPGPGAPVPLRLFVEAILAAPLHLRGEPVPVTITLRELLARLWPNRRMKPKEYLPQLEAAREALASREAGIPWPGGTRWAVTLTNEPRGLDDDLRLVVDLPPGSEHGPQVSERLHLYGPRRGRHYRALLNLAYWWHEPGRTLRPVRRRKHWLRVHDPARYRKPTDAELVNLVFPTSARGQVRNLVHEAANVLADLGRDGELRIVDGKPLPPLPPAGEADE